MYDSLILMFTSFYLDPSFTTKGLIRKMLTKDILTINRLHCFRHVLDSGMLYTYRQILLWCDDDCRYGWHETKFSQFATFNRYHSCMLYITVG